MIFIVLALYPHDKIPRNALITVSSFWGSIIGIIVVYLIFRNNNLWVLYSNLQKSKLKYFTICLITYIIMAQIIKSIFRIFGFDI